MISIMLIKTYFKLKYVVHDFIAYFYISFTIIQVGSTAVGLSKNQCKACTVRRSLDPVKVQRGNEKNLLSATSADGFFNLSALLESSPSF